MDRSLEDGTSHRDLEDESSLIILERLADGGYFQNNRRMFMKFDSPFITRLIRVIRSMKNLEKLHLLQCNLSLTEDLPQFFRSCPKLTDLRVRLSDPKRVDRKRFNRMNENRKNELHCYRILPKTGRKNYRKSVRPDR